MAISSLPWWPLLLFGILEPAALSNVNSIYGAFVLFSDPQEYVQKQVPSIVRVPLSAGSVSITLMLGNVFLLLAGIAILCCFTPHGAISRNYLIIVAFADLGHIHSSYAGMGSEYFWNIGAWNDMAWGNIGTSAFLCVNRVSTALGLFGRIGGAKKTKKT